MNQTTATTQTTISAKAHYINYCGSKIQINLIADNRLYIKFVSGSGYGDQSSWCEFNSTYDVYKPMKCYGDELVKVGTLHEVSGTDRKSFEGYIDGKPIKMEGYCADSIFMKIFANEN